MTLIDCTGFTGVAILLIAYFLNLNNKLARDNRTYILLNLGGSGLACFASVLLQYLPFIILEGAWTIVSFFALIKIAIK